MTYYTGGQKDEREKCERVDFPPPPAVKRESPRSVKITHK